MADEIFHYPQNAVDAFTRQLNDDIAGIIKLLLEEKHLYQKVSVDPDGIAAKIILRVSDKDRQWTSEHIRSVMNQRLTLTSGAPLLTAPRGQEPQVIPALMLRNVRLFCQTCNERQTFKPVWYQDAANDLLRQAAHGEAEITFDATRLQLFFIAYQCEHCHGAPESDAAVGVLCVYGSAINYRSRQNVDRRDCQDPRGQQGVRQAPLSYHLGNTGQ